MHGGPTNSVLVKNDLVISDSNDKTVQVWCMETHEKLWQLDLESEVNCTVLRGDQVISCCSDETVRVLDLESGEQSHRLDHPYRCINADLSPNNSLLAVACDTAVVIWDMKKVVKMKEVELGSVENPVQDLKFNPTGDKLIVGLHEGEIFKIELE